MDSPGVILHSGPTKTKFFCRANNAQTSWKPLRADDTEWASIQLIKNNLFQISKQFTHLLMPRIPIVAPMAQKSNRVPMATTMQIGCNEAQQHAAPFRKQQPNRKRHRFESDSGSGDDIAWNWYPGTYSRDAITMMPALMTSDSGWLMCLFIYLFSLQLKVGLYYNTDNIDMYAYHVSFLLHTLLFYLSKLIYNGFVSCIRNRKINK